MIDKDVCVITAIGIAQNGRMALQIEHGIEELTVYVELPVADKLAADIRYLLAKAA